MKKAKLIYSVSGYASGKTTLAKEMAAERGEYMTVFMDNLLTGFGRSVLLGHPPTIIIEGFNIGNDKHVALSKIMVSGDPMVVERRCHDPETLILSGENLIFVSKQPIVGVAKETSRRFDLIETKKLKGCILCQPPAE